MDCISPVERLMEKPLENNVGEYLYDYSVGKVLKYHQENTIKKMDRVYYTKNNSSSRHTIKEVERHPIF